MNDVPASDKVLSEPAAATRAGPERSPGGIIAFLRGRPFVPAVALLTGLFFLLTVVVLRADLRPTDWDVWITREIQLIPAFPLGDLLSAVSRPGFSPWNLVLGAVVLLFMLLRRWLIEAAFTAFSAAGGALAELVKNMVDRPRPDPDLVRVTAQLPTYSFPSGHVTGYVVFFGFLFYLAYTLLKRDSRVRLALLVVCGLLVVLVGPSRVYMGQHWASDALAGYALGFAYLLLVIEVHQLWLRRRAREQGSEVGDKGPVVGNGESGIGIPDHNQ